MPQVYDTCFLFGAGPFFGLPVPPQPGILSWPPTGVPPLPGRRAAPRSPVGRLGLPGNAPQALPVQTFPAEKDDTDTMLAVKYALAQGCTTVHLYGRTGGRLDHTLANLQTLGYLAQTGAAGYLYDEIYVFTALADGHLTLPAREAGIFSLFCLGEAARGSPFGGQYPLDRATLSPFFPLGVSNHFLGNPVEIQVEHRLPARRLGASHREPSPAAARIPPENNRLTEMKRPAPPQQGCRPAWFSFDLHEFCREVDRQDEQPSRHCPNAIVAHGTHNQRKQEQNQGNDCCKVVRQVGASDCKGRVQLRFLSFHTPPAFFSFQANTAPAAAITTVRMR